MEQISDLILHGVAFVIDIGGQGSSQNDLGDLSRLHQEIESKKKEVEDKDKQLELLVRHSIFFLNSTSS